MQPGDPRGRPAQPVVPEIDVPALLVVPPDRGGDEYLRNQVRGPRVARLGVEERPEDFRQQRDGGEDPEGQGNGGHQAQVQRPDGRASVVAGRVVIPAPAAADQPPVDGEHR